jgi:hypothetical protein
MQLTKSFTPALNDVGFIIMLFAKHLWGMTCIMFDIETEFHHRYLNEEIYMEVPKGLTIGENKKVILREIIYGLL